MTTVTELYKQLRETRSKSLNKHLPESAKAVFRNRADELERQIIDLGDIEGDLRVAIERHVNFVSLNEVRPVSFWSLPIWRIEQTSVGYGDSEQLRKVWSVFYPAIKWDEEAFSKEQNEVIRSYAVAHDETINDEIILKYQKIVSDPPGYEEDYH